MPENPNPEYKIKKNHIIQISLALLSLVNGILNFFSLKKSKRFWGIVYDSVSKQPLDPVIVKLLYADGREVQTSVTDIGGRYGFLASPGKFKIFVKKTNYSFPSKYAKGGHDGIYDNIYHGEFFVLADDSEVVGPNIPMDPEEFDWNQQAKKSVERTYPFWRFFFKKLVALIFWFGLGLSLLEVWKLYPKSPYCLYYILDAYLVLMILAKILPEDRLWGLMKIKIPGGGLQGLLLELKRPQFPQMTFGKTFVNEEGRFLLRANPGKYLMAVIKLDKKNQKTYLCSRPVSIGRNGVLNSTFKVFSHSIIIPKRFF